MSTARQDTGHVDAGARPASREREGSAWSRVRVDDVSVHAALTPPDSQVVCASVALPDRYPADVIVELTLEDDDGRPIAGSTHRRMWSERAYADDRFMFVARVPDGDLATARRIAVTVSPGVAAEREQVAPVCASMPLRAD